MADTGRPRSGDRAVALLASWFTLAGGAFCCLFIVLSSSPDRRQVWLTIAGLCAAMALLSWLLRERRGEQPGWSWLWRPRKRKHVYRLARKTIDLSPEREEPNRPPTVDELRDLRTSQNTWVPRGGR